MDKHKYVKRNVAVEMESVALRLDNYVDVSKKETFHEFLRSSTNIISNNIYSEKDNTVKLLIPLIKNYKIAILAADKEACTIILNKSDFFKKVNKIIEEGMEQGKYIENIDTTQSDLKHFQDFLYRHFKRSEHCDQMRPVSNQPARFFATAKTHKFTSLNDITVENLKLRPITDLTGTYTYNTSKVIANYLRPLSKNQYTISDTLKFPELLKSADPNANYEDVSYDVESLSTSIPVAETTEYILKRIYTNKELKPLSKKPIFKKLLIKLTKESVFSVNNRLIKQIDGCPMGGSISVVFPDSYMCKMEEDVVKPLKPIFYKRYVDDTYVKKTVTNQILFLMR